MGFDMSSRSKPNCEEIASYFEKFGAANWAHIGSHVIQMEQEVL